jgi:hypothetical protein
MKIETLKRFSLLAAMALLFGAINLIMYDFLPQEFMKKYFWFETKLSLAEMLMIIISFGLIPAGGFSIIFHQFERGNIDKGSKVRSFFKGSVPGFIGSLLLGLLCLRGLGQTNFGAVGMAIISFLVLAVVPSMILGGIARIKLPERRSLSFLIAVMVFAGGMSSFLSLKVFIRLFFSRG